MLSSLIFSGGRGLSLILLLSILTVNVWEIKRHTCSCVAAYRMDTFFLFEPLQMALHCIASCKEDFLV